MAGHQIIRRRHATSFVRFQITAARRIPGRKHHRGAPFPATYLSRVVISLGLRQRCVCSIVEGLQWKGCKGGFNVYVEFLEKNSVTLQCNIHLGNYFGALSKFEIFNLVIIKTMKFFCVFFLDS